MIHYIHCHQPYDMNKGGTVGYVSSLMKSMIQSGSFVSKKNILHSFIMPDSEEKTQNYLYTKIKDMQFSEVYEYQKHSKLKIITDRKKWFYSMLPLNEFVKINPQRIKSIHINGAYNFLPVYNSLKALGLHDKTIKILTTHNPWKPALEDMELITRNIKWSEENKQHLKYFFDKRDYYAFSLADAYLFPSEESMEGYYKYWPDFKNIIKNKKIYFVLTGTEKKIVFTDKNRMKKELGIPENAFVFLFLGRFVNVRGYDIYIESAKRILKQYNNIYFISVGESKNIPSIEHPYWKEISFTKCPGDFINMADACIIPNRGSFFDLSMIEILALGKILICADVGGYQWLKNKTDGVFYFQSENIDQLVSKIIQFTQLNPHDVKRLQGNNELLYKELLDIKYFSYNYKEAIDKMYDDFHIKNTYNKYFKNVNIQYSLESRLIPTKDYSVSIENQIPQKYYHEKNSPIYIRKMNKLKRDPKLFFKDMLKNIFIKYFNVL